MSRDDRLDLPPWFWEPVNPAASGPHHKRGRKPNARYVSVHGMPLEIVICARGSALSHFVDPLPGDRQRVGPPDPLGLDHRATCTIYMHPHPLLFPSGIALISQPCPHWTVAVSSRLTDDEIRSAMKLFRIPR